MIAFCGSKTEIAYVIRAEEDNKEDEPRFKLNVVRPFKNQHFSIPIPFQIKFEEKYPIQLYINQENLFLSIVNKLYCMTTRQFFEPDGED